MITKILFFIFLIVNFVISIVNRNKEEYQKATFYMAYSCFYLILLFGTEFLDFVDLTMQN